MINVSSEVGALKRMIIHRPDKGIEQVTPSKAFDLLYEDIVYLEKMQEEHDVFSSLLCNVIGVENVLDIETLLTEILHQEQVSKSVIKVICHFESCEQHEEALLKLTPEQLASTLITGVLGKQTLFQPVPNYIFCRDIAVVINEYVLLSQASKRTRARESILTRFVFQHHPKLQKQRIELSSIEELSNAYRNGDNPLSIEGGDVMMFNKQNLLIGCSERTSAKAIEMLRDFVLQNDIIESVVKIDLPKERYCMHLDTIFTLVDHNECVVFEPLMLADKLSITKHYKDGNVSRYTTLKDLILSINPDMKFIPCGNGEAPFEEREQWTDGCNLFALKPGVVVTYDRNSRTVEAFKQRGYDIKDARYLATALNQKTIDFNDIKKTLIIIPSNELSRARGGTHCLTLPLWRA
jgi:arginine deiminase